MQSLLTDLYVQIHKFLKWNIHFEDVYGVLIVCGSVPKKNPTGKEYWLMEESSKIYVYSG